MGKVTCAPLGCVHLVWLPFASVLVTPASVRRLTIFRVGCSLTMILV